MTNPSRPRPYLGGLPCTKLKSAKLTSCEGESYLEVPRRRLGATTQLVQVVGMADCTAGARRRRRPRSSNATLPPRNPLGGNAAREGDVTSSQCEGFPKRAGCIGGVMSTWMGAGRLRGRGWGFGGTGDAVPIWISNGGCTCRMRRAERGWRCVWVGQLGQL
jgi:hypothetical protein